MLRWTDTFPQNEEASLNIVQHFAVTLPTKNKGIDACSIQCHHFTGAGTSWISMITSVLYVTWMPTEAVNFDQAGQSSWSKGSSIDTTVGEERCVTCMGLIFPSDQEILHQWPYQ